MQEVYVEEAIVPLLASPEGDESKFRFIGSGFYVGEKGHLITCRHVVDGLRKGEKLYAYQIGKKRQLKLKVVVRSEKYDLALCQSSSPGLTKSWPIIEEPFITLGSNVEVYGYWHEPLGPDELPFRQRYLKGYITGIPLDPKYHDSFELDFPVLFGLSGSPLLYHAPIEGESTKQTGIVGCAYGSLESRVVTHSEISSEAVSRIVELGLAYKPKAIRSILQGSGVSINIFSEKRGDS